MKKIETRQTQIVEVLCKEKRMEVVKLSEMLNVSQVTIRKDLDALEERGLITREHGFATLNSDDDMNIRLAIHYESKQQIAKMACASIQNGETIMIESGSCCALLADEIGKTKKDVTIITNSAFIADYIRKYKNIHMILLGGNYQKESQVLVGPLLRNSVRTFFVDKLFIGTDGFSKETGFTGNDYMRSEAVRDMAKQAKHVIIVTESTKFEQIGLCNLLPLEEISMVDTDGNMKENWKEYLETKNAS